jgi:hypothetical protein
MSKQAKSKSQAKSFFAYMTILYLTKHPLVCKVVS